MSENLEFFKKGLIALHRLLRQGKDDSPEAEEIRDSLDKPWASLTEEEKEEMRIFSEELYTKPFSLEEPSEKLKWESNE